MKSDNRRNKIGRILLALSFLVGIGLASSSAAQAQRTWDRDQARNQDRQDRREQVRRERERRERESNRNRDNSRNRDYRRDDRTVYSNGGYGGYGGYGNNGGYGNSSQVSINQGYQDGLFTGSNDAQRGQSYNPQRSHFYKNGHSDGGYSYGNPQAYRSGFLRGYDEGFRRSGGGYNRNGRSGNRFPW